MITLVTVPLAGLRRAFLGWAVALGALIAVTVAFWPAFSGSSGISQAIDSLPSPVVQAFGLQDFGSPAGFLRGNLYEFVVPLLLVGAGVAVTSGQTAGDEDAGRLELILAQPVHRAAVLAGRATAVLVWLVALGLVLLGVQLVSDAVFGLSIATSAVGATLVLCVEIGLLYASLAFALAGVLPRPSVVLGIGIGVALASYLVSALFPLSPSLAAWRVISPWNWALGGDPLSEPTEPWRYLALLVPMLALTGVGLVGFGRRDVRAA